MDSITCHFDQIADKYDFFKRKNWYYYTNLKLLLKKLSSRNSDILDYGCGTGDVLNFLNPKYGFGYDRSVKMLLIAKKKYPELNFGKTIPNKKFDLVIMTDVIEHFRDIKTELDTAEKHMNKNSKLIITMANPMWEWLLLVAEKLNLKMPEGQHNRVSAKEIINLSRSSNLKLIKHDYDLLMPVYIPLFTKFINRNLSKLFKKLSFIEYLVFEKT